ncbi:MAG: COX15/CtaA family protein [Pseudomonadota bacterium]
MALAQPIMGARQLVVREERNRLLVRSWLYVICALIFAMVLVGGATRLTDSGLSITEWKPLLGAIPPLSAEHWAEEFEKYRQIPEYQQINKGMSLSEFKVIYWWEWAHRFLGRFIGLAFALPLAWFWVSGRLEARMKPRLLALLVLGGFQGFIGWWMVTSGLVERTDVSQYRLAIHLTLACLIFAYALWIARGLARYSVPPARFALRILAPIIAIAVLVQIFLGGLVAGLDAGLAFNDWPTMDYAIIPTGLFQLSPAWLNFFENPKTVQFVHRIGGYILLLLALIQLIATMQVSTANTHKARAVIMFALVTIQAAIGIVTLVLQVPMSWALMHQGGAVIVLAFAVAHWRAIYGGYAPQSAIQIRS